MVIKVIIPDEDWEREDKKADLATYGNVDALQRLTWAIEDLFPTACVEMADE